MQNPFRLFLTVVIGLASGMGIGAATEYCTSSAYYPVQVSPPGSEGSINDLWRIDPIMLSTARGRACGQRAHAEGLFPQDDCVRSNLSLTHVLTCDLDGPPLQSIAKASETGPATVIIAGLAIGMFSTVPPVLFIVVAIVASLALSGIYGVALAAVRTSVELSMTAAASGRPVLVHGPYTLAHF